jgi:hypothetical protein
MVKILGSATAAGLMILALGASGASATPIPVTNNSFETGTISSVTGWTGTGSFGIFAPVSPTQYALGGDGLSSPNRIVPAGNDAGYLAGVSTLSQSLGVLFLANTTYTLDVFVGHRNDDSGVLNNSFAFPSSVSLAFTSGGTQLTGSGTLLLAGVNIPAKGQWVEDTLTFSTGASGGPIGSILGIELLDGGSSGQENFDLVTVNAVTTAPNGGGTGIPEPFTLSIFGAGLVGAAALRRRRKA